MSLLDTTPQFAAAVYAPKRLTCPDKIRRGATFNVGGLLDKLLPGGSAPFLVLTKVLKHTTLCFTVDPEGNLRIANFIPCGTPEENFIKKVQKADNLNELLESHGTSKNVSQDPNRDTTQEPDKDYGQLHVWGPNNFHRTKKEKNKYARKKEYDRCNILVLWDGTGWRVYAQLIRLFKHGDDVRYEPVEVVRL